MCVKVEKNKSSSLSVDLGNYLLRNEAKINRSSPPTKIAQLHPKVCGKWCLK